MKISLKRSLKRQVSVDLMVLNERFFESCSIWNYCSVDLNLFPQAAFQDQIQIPLNYFGLDHDQRRTRQCKYAEFPELHSKFNLSAPYLGGKQKIITFVMSSASCIEGLTGVLGRSINHAVVCKISTF